MNPNDTRPAPSPVPLDRSWEDETTGYGPDITAHLRSMMTNHADLPSVDGSSDDETTMRRPIAVPRRAFRESYREPTAELSLGDLLPRDPPTAERTTRRPPARAITRPSHPYRRFPAPAAVAPLPPPRPAPRVEPPPPARPPRPAVPGPAPPTELINAPVISAPGRPYASPRPVALASPAASPSPVASPSPLASPSPVASPRPVASPNHVASPRPVVPRPVPRPAPRQPPRAAPHPSSPFDTPPVRALPSTPPRDGDKRRSPAPVPASASWRMLQWMVLALAGIGSVCVGWLLANLLDAQTPMLAPATLARDESVERPTAHDREDESSALGATEPSAVMIAPLGTDATEPTTVTGAEPAQAAPTAPEVTSGATPTGDAEAARAAEAAPTGDAEAAEAAEAAPMERETSERETSEREASERSSTQRATTRRQETPVEDSWVATPVPDRVWPSTVSGGGTDRARSDHLVALARQARGVERRQLLWEAAHAHRRNPQVAYLFARDSYYEGDLEVAEAWAREALSMRRRRTNFRALLSQILNARAATGQ